MRNMKFWMVASTVVGALWWIGGDDAPVAPVVTPETHPVPEVGNDGADPHRFTLPEIHTLLQSGAGLGDGGLRALTGQDVCALGVASQEGVKVKPDFAACARRHPELDLGLLVAGAVAGPGVINGVGKADLCGMFWMAAMRADLADAQKQNSALPAQAQVIDSINASFIACEERHGKDWTVSSDLWEKLGRSVVLNKFYPEPETP